MSHGGDRRSDQAANLPLVSKSQAADMLNVGVRSDRPANLPLYEHPAAPATQASAAALLSICESRIGSAYDPIRRGDNTRHERETDANMAMLGTVAIGRLKMQICILLAKPQANKALNRHSPKSLILQRSPLNAF
jgi:hypothetical protein